MEKIIFKHMGLPIRDMLCEIQIDHPGKIVTLAVDHFDSALVIIAARAVEEKHTPIRLIDRESRSSQGPARIENLYRLQIEFDGRAYDARIMKLSISDELTVSLMRRADERDSAQ